MLSNSIIQRVLFLQAEALLHFRSTYSQHAFDQALTFLKRSPLIFTLGVGKSACVAQKIAETLTSVGSPAIFLSAEQLLHGGLNLLAVEDTCLLVISKSGETSELLDVFRETCYTSIKKVVIASSEHSTLAKLADVVIAYGDVEECCPYNLVPTTSTTLSLVIGDVLAAMLMDVNEFTREKFSQTHPGGSLGILLRRSLKKSEQGETPYERNTQQQTWITTHSRTGKDTI